MRRTVLVLVVTAMLLGASGVALAATTVGGVPDAGTVQTDGQRNSAPEDLDLPMPLAREASEDV